LILIRPNGYTACHDPLVALENVLEPFPGRRFQDQTLIDSAFGLGELVLNIRYVHISIINDPILVILVLIPPLLLL
jgi:hypothetical protein